MIRLCQKNEKFDNNKFATKSNIDFTILFELKKYNYS